MVATLAGEPFHLDPTQVSWEYNVHVADKPMIGGKVVQVFGASIGDITVVGKHGRSGSVEGLLSFLDRMKKLSAIRTDHASVEPLRFFWPEMGWDFRVYLKDYASSDGPMAIVHSPENFSPSWRLTLFPVSGTESLKAATVTTFIERLSAGMGWRKTKYNGLLTYEEVSNVVASTGANSLSDYLNMAYGLGTMPTNTGIAPDVAAPGTAFAQGRNLTAEEVLRLASRYWSGTELRVMVAVAGHESGGWNPRAVNAKTRATGLWQINLSAHGDRFGTQEELFIPERNVAAAYEIWKSQGRNAWTSYTNQRYLQYWNQVKETADRMGL